MKMFAEHPIHSRKTGKLEGYEFRECGLFCDYCGAVIDTEGYGQGYCQQVKFVIEEVGGAEETYYYYYGSAYGIPDSVDMHKIFENHRKYDYCTDEDSSSCSAKLVGPVPLPEGVPLPTNLETVMQYARLRVVAKLLREGRSAKELGIEKD